jgi:SpoVK/Ycf46/Vps4 family AAA+-type ATPase
MQGRKAPVFVAATCNNVSALPPELIRKGRFDELFFVDLPTAPERRQILALQLARCKRRVEDFNLEQIAAAARGYSGAEIEAALQSALYAAFSRNQDLTTEALLTAMAQTVPLSATRAEEIQALRTWAHARAVPASTSSERAAPR